MSNERIVREVPRRRAALPRRWAQSPTPPAVPKPEPEPEPRGFTTDADIAEDAGFKRPEPQANEAYLANEAGLTVEDLNHAVGIAQGRGIPWQAKPTATVAPDGRILRLDLAGENTPPYTVNVVPAVNPGTASPADLARFFEQDTLPRRR